MPPMLSEQLQAAPNDWRYRWTVLLEKIERVETESEEQTLMEQLVHPAKPFVLAFANAHAMNSMVTSAPFFDAMKCADMVLRDGSGMASLFKLLGMAPGRNLNGTDLIPRLIRQFDGRPIAFFGTVNPYLEDAVVRVRRELAPLSKITAMHGFLEVAAYVTLAAKHKPALIVLGMGMPRQEEVAVALRSALPFPCLIVCGGAIIDFLGGKTPRAPLLLRKIGLEWLFRLAIEPRRLFARYVIGNPLFLLRSLRLALFSRT